MIKLRELEIKLSQTNTENLELKEKIDGLLTDIDLLASEFQDLFSQTVENTVQSKGYLT